MYASDYGYAADLSLCLNQVLSEYRNTPCRSNNWLYNSSFHQWTMSSRALSSRADYVYFVNTVGNLTAGEAAYGRAIRPVIYLKTDAVISSGTGTEADPYILTLSNN